MCPNVAAHNAQKLFSYSAYGAGVLSDIPLAAANPGSPEQDQTQIIELSQGRPETLALQNATQHIALNPIHGRELRAHFGELPVAGEPIAEEHLSLEVLDLVHFYIADRGCLHYVAKSTCEPEQIEFWFLHVFLPIYLSLFRDGYFFHGAAVEKHGVVQAFVGPTRSGKSTLVEAMLARGYRLYADDKFRITTEEGVVVVHASHGRFRPYRKTEDLGVPARRRGQKAAPLAGLFILETRDASSSLERAPLSGAEAVARLMESILYSFQRFRGQGLKTAAGLAEAGLVYGLRRPWGREHLAETARTLESWLTKS